MARHISAKSNKMSLKRERRKEREGEREENN